LREDVYQDMTLQLAEKWASEVDLCQGTACPRGELASRRKFIRAAKLLKSMGL
jgi:hypothetical protein